MWEVVVAGVWEVVAVAAVVVVVVVVVAAAAAVHRESLLGIVAAKLRTPCCCSLTESGTVGGSVLVAVGTVAAAVVGAGPSPLW